MEEMKSGAMENMPKVDQKDVDENKGMAILSYISILVLIPFFTKKDSAFVQYHAKQGLTLFIGELIVWILGAIIPFLGWFIIAPIGGLVALVFAIMGIVNAANGKVKELPLIGSVAHKLFK